MNKIKKKKQLKICRDNKKKHKKEVLMMTIKLNSRIH